MIREARFVLSHRPYAVNLSTLRGDNMPLGDGFAFHGTIDAAWYRRTSGVTRACIGTVGLWSGNRPLPAPLDLDDPSAVLAADLDGRYGGHCHGRGDGTSYWGNVPLTVQQEHLAVLAPMLDAYPAIPDGYDGWWRF